jgi:hypothetical protein
VCGRGESARPALELVPNPVVSTFRSTDLPLNLHPRTAVHLEKSLPALAYDDLYNLSVARSSSPRAAISSLLLLCFMLLVVSRSFAESGHTVGLRGPVYYNGGVDDGMCRPRNLAHPHIRTGPAKLLAAGLVWLGAVDQDRLEPMNNMRSLWRCLDGLSVSPTKPEGGRGGRAVRGVDTDLAPKYDVTR